ncbi:hypothetical protein PsYK624_014860 [Phanerochaete sordida]|uniref:Uncharacterized protein n=1 Tax=Phanerochaete sordida TaxID=48140 RepID=A0A9P3L966_9APHY|nr:hypothetical protein PsYK624_014860 [Phanerochaete sordida]
MQYPNTPSSHQGQAAPRTPPSQTGQIHHTNGQLPTPHAPYMHATALPYGAQAPVYAGFPPTPYMPTVPLPMQHTNTGLLTPPDSPASRTQALMNLNPHLTNPGFAYDLKYDVERSGLRSGQLRESATFPGTGSLVVYVQTSTGHMHAINVGDGRTMLTVGDVLHRLHRELNRAFPDNTNLLHATGRRYIFEGLEYRGGDTCVLKHRR